MATVLDEIKILSGIPVSEATGHAANSAYDRIEKAVRDSLKLKVGKIPPRSKMMPVVKEIAKHTKDKFLGLDIFGLFFKGADPDDFDALWKKATK